MRDGLAAGDRVQLHINNGKKKAYIRNGLAWIKRFPVGRSAAFCPGRVKSASGRYCCKSLFGAAIEFPKPLMRFTRGEVRGPYRLIQNRSRVPVTALKSDAATE
jgi:hypothetical protein